MCKGFHVSKFVLDAVNSLASHVSMSIQTFENACLHLHMNTNEIILENPQLLKQTSTEKRK